MLIAQRIARQIISHYQPEDGSCPNINYSALASHLKADSIDFNESIADKLGLEYHQAQHCGYDAPISGDLPVVFYYDDRSILIVAQGNITVATRC